jgi:uncharacterized membrane protein HdeD (DUF308 family)
LCELSPVAASAASSTEDEHLEQRRAMLRQSDSMDIASKVVPAPGAVAGDERTDVWWVFLVAGGLWLVFALLVFQFDASTVTAVSTLLGITCVGGASLELIAIPASHGWWRVGRVALAIAFATVGTVAFIDPGRSFEGLATIFAFYLLLRGAFEIIAALVMRGSEALWWLLLVPGTAQILLAFWAAGDFGHKAFLLTIWVGATALLQGIVEIVRAFAVRPA